MISTEDLPMQDQNVNALGMLPSQLPVLRQIKKKGSPGEFLTPLPSSAC